MTQPAAGGDPTRISKSAAGLSLIASAETRADATPILDREAPLPPRTPPGSGLIMVLAVWWGVFLVITACWLLDRPPIVRQWFLTGFRPWLLDQCARIGSVGLGFSVLCAFYLMIAIHELGHLVVGLCVGFRCRSLRIGPLVFSPPLRLSLYRGPGAIVNGVAELMPVAADKLAWRGVAMVLGGPAANFLSALAVFLLPFPLTAFSGFFIACSIANGLSDLVPFESRLGVSDGKRIWMLLRQPERGARWLALFRLAGELSDGVLPEALSTEFLAKAIAVRDASADTVSAHLIAYSAAFHEHNDTEAARRLETCLEYSGYATPIVREALMSDAAVFQARRRKRVDLANQWLAQIPLTTQNAWFRSRSEAAILEAKGDADAAIAKLADGEKAILALTKSAQRDALERLLERWKSELRRS
jgi:hypothetical protein